MNLLIRIFLSVVIITVFFVSANAQKLRLIHSISLSENAEIYGISSNDIIIKEDSILSFYNRQWKIRSEIDFGKDKVPVVSDNGRFYAVVEKGENDSSSGQGTNIATIYNNRGVSQWGTFDIADGDYYLDPNGDFLVVISSGEDYFSAKSYMYHKELQPIELPAVGFESLTIASDGKHLLLNLGHYGDKLYSSKGKLIAEYPHHSISDFDSNSEYMAHFSKNEVSLVENGKEVESFELKGVLLKDFEYNHEYNRLALMYPNSVILFDLNNKEKIWQYHPMHKNGKFMSIDYSASGKYIVCGIDINLGGAVVDSLQHTTGYLYFYGSEGKKFSEYKIEYKDYRNGYPIVEFLPGDRIVTVRTVDKLYFIEMY